MPLDSDNVTPESFKVIDRFRWPDGVPRKPIEELTPEQRQVVLDAYRFSGFRPSTYQGVTGDEHSVG